MGRCELSFVGGDPKSIENRWAFFVHLSDCFFGRQSLLHKTLHQGTNAIVLDRHGRVIVDSERHATHGVDVAKDFQGGPLF